MHRFRWIALASLLLLCPAWAQQAKEESGCQTGVPQAIERLQNMRILALRRGDVASLSLILPNDFTIVGPNGEVFTKVQLLEAIDGGWLTFDSFTFDDTEVCSFAHSAAVSGHYTARAQYKGQSLSGRYRFRQVVAKHGQLTSVSFESDSFVGPVTHSGETVSVVK